MATNDQSHGVSNHPHLMTTTEASEHLAISPRTLWAITSPRGPLPVVRLGPSGRTTRYDPTDLALYIERQKSSDTTIASRAVDPLGARSHG